MKFELKQIASHELDRCYAIAPLKYKNKDHILIAAEKVNKCMLFDTDGKYEDTIWEEPGGTMSMIQVPGKDGMFLATHEFYSPNDSANSKIVLVKEKDGRWEIQVVKELPFVHRFSIISSEGKNYIIACTLKSEHHYKDDWEHPGKILVCELPEDIENYNIDHQLDMKVIKEGLTKNHGYCTVHTKDGDYSLVGTDNGIFKAVPPSSKNKDWTVEKIADVQASDMAICDFDGDGIYEMIVISDFHGENIMIFKEKEDGKFEKIYQFEEKFEFAHAIWTGEISGKKLAIIGHRKGKRNLLAFYFEDGEYKRTVLKEDIGPTNVDVIYIDGRARLISTNREINEIAFYDIDVK